MTIKKKKLIIWIVSLLMVVILIQIAYFNIQKTSELEYNVANDEWPTRWIVGAKVQQKNNNIGELIVLENIDEPIYLTFGHSFLGENSATEFVLNVYYDYKPISYKIDDSEYIYNYYFTKENNTIIEIPIVLNSDEVSLDENIHKLFITFTSGVDYHAKEIGFANNRYGENIRYDIVHSKTYNDKTTISANNFETMEAFNKKSSKTFGEKFTINMQEIVSKSDVDGIESPMQGLHP